jgi:DNA-binding LacI/PurR family transcriptional regulator
VDQGTFEIGKRAANLLLDRIDSKRSLRPRKVLIVPKLVVRQSTRRSKSDAAADAENTPSRRT